MTILSWIGAVVVIFWLLGLLFRIAGLGIHVLLIVAAVFFIVDLIKKRRK